MLHVSFFLNCSNCLNSSGSYKNMNEKRCKDKNRLQRNPTQKKKTRKSDILLFIYIYHRSCNTVTFIFLYCDTNQLYSTLHRWVNSTKAHHSGSVSAPDRLIPHQTQSAGLYWALSVGIYRGHQLQHTHCKTYILNNRQMEWNTQYPTEEGQ